MKYTHTVFRKVNEWKSALMTLPDSRFFELLKSVFGNIKTPFNKQTLLNDLFVFLSRNEIQKVIEAYINEQDHKIIAAVALLKEPSLSETASFFKGEGGAEIQSGIINLEERLIIYRFRDEEIFRLALNPVLEPVLLPFIEDTSVLFPFMKNRSAEAKKAKESDEAAAGNPGVFAALLAFLFDNDCHFKIDDRIDNSAASVETKFPNLRSGGVLNPSTRIKKSILSKGKKIFPFLNFELTLKVFCALELLEQDSAGLAPCPEKIAGFCGLSQTERREYWAAAVYLCISENEKADFFSSGSAFVSAGIRDTEDHSYRSKRNRIRDLAFFIHRFMAILDSKNKYPEVTLRRLVELLEREDSGRGKYGDFSFFPRDIKPDFDFFMAAAEKAGLLKKAGAYRYPPDASVPPPENTCGEENPEKPVIMMDTAFSFMLLPEISFADAAALAAFSSLKEPLSDTTPDGAAFSFEITCSRTVRAFDEGLSAASMIKILKRLSHNRIDSSLEWTLNDWESRYKDISLHRGVVLCLSEDRRYLAEAGSVASLIHRTLAPGIYLLSSTQKSEAAAALLKAGVDIVARPDDAFEHTGNSDCGKRSYGFTALSLPRETNSVFSFPENGAAPLKEKTSREEKAEAIKAKLRSDLAGIKSDRAEKEELLARIERCIILDEAQLKEASLSYEKLEARGLDYAGKSAIAKQAIASNSLLEVYWQGSGGTEGHAIGIPQTMEKKESGVILTMKVFREKDEASGKGAPLEIPLGKISLLRRIKQSIFEGG